MDSEIDIMAISQLKNNCESNPCSEFAVCVNTIGHLACLCTEGYTELVL